MPDRDSLAAASSALPLPPRDPGFAGRAALLATLRVGLGLAARPWVLAGPPGAGATSVALELAHGRAHAYRLVAWVRAHDAWTLARDLATLGAALGLGDAARDALPALAAKTRAWLEAHDGWLLVFDGARDAAALGALLPRAKGHVVVTTALPAEAATDLGEVLAVAPWSRAEAGAFLAARVEGAAAEACEALGEALGGNALALALASAAARARGVEGARRALGESARRDPVAAGFALAWSEAASIEAAATLARWAALGEGTIPGALAGDGAALVAAGLAAETADGVRLHPRVRALAAATLGTERIAAAGARAATEMVAGLGDPADPAAWARWGAWLPHLVAAARSALAGDGHRAPAAAAALHVAALHLRARGDHGAALAVAREALGVLDATAETARGALGARARGLATTLRVVAGEAAAAAGDGARGVALLEDALARVEREDGAASRAASAVWAALGDALGARDAARAGECHARAFAIGARAGAAPGESAARVAAAWAARGDHEAAGRWYRAAADAERRAHAAPTPALAAWLGGATAAALARGDHDAARRVGEAALAAAEAAHGARSAAWADAAQRLGDALVALGDRGSARDLFRRALRARGVESRDEAAAALHGRLGDVASALGDLDAAATHYAAAARVYAALRGPRDREVGRLAAALGWVAQRGGDLEAAAKHYRRAAPIVLHRGEDPAEGVWLALRWGMLERARGDLAAAARWLGLARRGCERAPRPDPRAMVATLRELGEVSAAKGDAARAWTLLGGALELAQAALGAEHPEAKALLRRLGIKPDARGN